MFMGFRWILPRVLSERSISMNWSFLEPFLSAVGSHFSMFVCKDCANLRGSSNPESTTQQSLAIDAWWWLCVDSCWESIKHSSQLACRIYKEIEANKQESRFTEHQNQKQQFWVLLWVGWRTEITPPRLYSFDTWITSNWAKWGG